MDGLRLQVLNHEPMREDGAYVLYWMTASRRLGWNHALDRAVWWAERLDRPLLIFEALRVDYRWASDRHHRFVMDGMAEHDDALRGTGVGYFPYVEPAPGHGSGLLEALGRHASCVVTDDSPVFFTPGLLKAAARLDVRVEAVDSCGLLPIRAAGKAFGAAYHFRRFLQRELPRYLTRMPEADPIRALAAPPFGEVPREVLERWTPTSPEELSSSRFLSALPIDHSVAPVAETGGRATGRERLRRFVEDGLDRYTDDKNHPDRGAGSGLSPWLHFGHVSPHEVFMSVVGREGWSPARLSDLVDGRRQGWWGMSPSAEAFLDQLVTWRELGFGYNTYELRYDAYDTLPEWARGTLASHAGDPREAVYTLEEFAAAETHDELWNAAQRQLLSEGVVHNYLRMLWGKKIIEWSPGPEQAWQTMIELNNRFAIDGRDPNSYAGIAWCFGRFDRGWPERPVYGKVRSMSSVSTRRKVSVDAYLSRWA